MPTDALAVPSPPESASPAPPPRWSARFRAGALAMMPLMVAAVPFGMIFGMSALAAGWSPVQTMTMSLALFAGAAQLAVVSLVSGGAAHVAVAVAVFVMNLRHVLYGMSLSRELPAGEPPPRPVLAFTLTDESYAVTVREARRGRAGAAFLWGGSLVLYVSWQLATLAGILLGDRIPDPRALGLDLVFPLTFFSLLLAVARTRRDWAVAALSGIIVVGLRRITDGGTALIAGTVVAALAGALLERGRG
ncbi:MAG: AzlC family ABC transporter permease [Chloroflexota bacterium]